MLRARPLAGDMSLGAAVLEDIRPLCTAVIWILGRWNRSITQGPDPPRGC